MLTFTIISDNLEKALEAMTSYFSSIYHDLVLIGNQVIAAIIVKEQTPYTITAILRMGEDSSLYNVTIIASGGYWSLLRQRELSQMETATKDFIENHIKFFKKRDVMEWPCSNCGEPYAYPVLSADGRYRCPKCAKPVDHIASQ